MIEEHHNCSTGNGKSSGCSEVVLTQFYFLVCVIWSNYKHFNLPSSYEFGNLELGELKIKNSTQNRNKLL